MKGELWQFERYIQDIKSACAFPNPQCTWAKIPTGELQKA